MKRKQFIKGTSQIAQEGAIQIFQDLGGGMEEVIVGVVGTLQFDVLEYRLKNEYNVDIRMEGLPYQYIRWIENEDLDPKTLNLTSDTKRIQDLKEIICSFLPMNGAFDGQKSIIKNFCLRNLGNHSQHESVPENRLHSIFGCFIFNLHLIGSSAIIKYIRKRRLSN